MTLDLPRSVRSSVRSLGHDAVAVALEVPVDRGLVEAHETIPVGAAVELSSPPTRGTGRAPSSAHGAACARKLLAIEATLVTGTERRLTQRASALTLEGTIRRGETMRKIELAVLGGLIVLTVALSAAPSGAAIHEQVATYCSGGGHGAIDEAGFLEPPGITDSTKKNFAQPVLANGVVEITTAGPVVTDAKPSKYPAGSSPFALPAPDHPSTHCAALR